MRSRWLDLFALCDAQAREVEAVPDGGGAARHCGVFSRRGRERVAVPRCAVLQTIGTCHMWADRNIWLHVLGDALGEVKRWRRRGR